jgi:hypothetical protein
MNRIAAIASSFVPGGPPSAARTRIRAGVALAVALGVGLAGAGPAAAASLCIDQSPTSVIVIPRFRVPARGKCKAYTGIVMNGLPAQGASGQACTTPDGSQVLVGLTMFIDGSPRFAEVQLVMPIGTATVLRERTFDGLAVTSTTASLCATP